MKRIRQFFTLILIPVDYVAVWLAFVSAYFLRLSQGESMSLYLMPWSNYVTVISWLALIWVAAYALVELYRYRGFSIGLQLLSRIALGVLIAFGAAATFIFFNKMGDDLSRVVLGYAAVLSGLYTFVARGLLFEFVRWLQFYGIGVEKVGIIGNNELAASFCNFIQEKTPSQKLIFTLPKIDWESLSKHRFNRLVLTEIISPETMLRLVRWCEDRGIILQYVPGLLGLYKFNVVTDYSADHPLIELMPTPLAGWGRIVKRVIDIILAILGLVVLSPIMLVIAIAIKLDSKGPVIFRQKRVGELGKPFTFYKFRSMKTELSVGDGYGGKEAEEYLAKLRRENNEGAGLLFKMKNDPRVTRVGSFIRKTSLDELPQLFNILLGNMSAVGPRPALPNEVEQYSDDLRRRLLVKPGVTGLWQVSGRSDADFETYEKLDTYYIENWSLWLDFKIILLTFRAVFSRKGSY